MTTDPHREFTGNDLYYASLYRPPEERDRVRLVDTIHRQVAAIPLSVSDRGVARVKLDWWHTEASELSEGRPRHELTRAYHQRFGLDDGIAPAVHALVAGLDRELGSERLATRAAQLAWFDATFGPIYRLYTPATEPLSDEDETVLGELARWTEMGYALLQLKALELRELHRFPSDVLESVGCTSDDLITGAHADAVIRFVTAESIHVGTALDTCRTALPDTLRPRARTLSTLASIVGRTLVEMRADGCRVWQHRITLTPLRKLWCAYRGRWA
jgi:phytoene synthase